MKKFVKGLTAAAAAAVLAVGMIPVIPAMPVEAASIASFKQEIIINDVTDAAHVEKIKTPDLKVEYLLTPVTDTATLPANDSRYVRSLSDFPTGNVEGDTGVQDKTVTIPSDTTGKTGKISFDVTKDKLLTGTDGSGTLAYPQASKVYRYRIIISGIFVGADDTNLLNSSQTNFTLPDDTTRYLDVSTDSDKKVTGIGFWDAAGTEKLEGYVGDEGGIKYNVSDIVVSSDYIGKNWDSLHGGLSYTVTLKNFPNYFTDADAIKSSVDDKGRSWEVDTTNSKFTQPAIKDNIFIMTGTFDQNSSLTIAGMPAGVEYDAEINFSKLKEAPVGGTKQDLRKQYGPAIFYGLDADQVTDVEDMKAFFSSDFASEYQYKAYKEDDDTRTTSEITDKDGITSNEAADVQSARFVIFDPNQLIVVGVIRRTAPAVLMVAVAAAILAALVASKKRALADTRYDFR